MGSNFDKDFLRNVTFRKEIDQNKIDPGRCLMALLHAMSSIALLAFSESANATGLAEFVVYMLFACNGTIAAFIVHTEYLKWEQRKYVRETIDWIMSNRA